MKTKLGLQKSQSLVTHLGAMFSGVDWQQMLGDFICFVIILSMNLMVAATINAHHAPPVPPPPHTTQ